MSWLPEGFVHPVRVPVQAGYHLRPIRAADTDLDYPAVMGSRERLWSTFGDAWGWPPATMTYEQDRDDLARHEAEIAAHQSFNYALLDDAETALLGCVYIDPPEKAGADAEISWWVVDDQAGTDPRTPWTSWSRAGSRPPGRSAARATSAGPVLDRLAGPARRRLTGPHTAGGRMRPLVGRSMIIRMRPYPICVRHRWTCPVVLI
jgi:hypothetical protein